MRKHEADPTTTDPGADAAASTDPAAPRGALLRFGGEVTLKADATRRRFTKRLIRNVKDALKSNGIQARVVREHDRIFIQSEGTSATELAVVARCFGLQSISLVNERPWQTIDDVVEAGLTLHREAVRGKRFAVRARRVGDRSRIRFHSQEVARKLGAALNEHAAGVDLSNPEVSVHVEVMPGRAYFFSESIPGSGGLPLGVEGRGVSLVSGGFDSAVSSWLMLKRGVALDYVFCNLGGRNHQLGVLKVMKQIADQWSYGLRPRLHSVDFDLVSRDLRANCTMRYWQVVLKRMMMRAGEQIALERDGLALVTGEAVGQVSSQTLQNLAVISRAVTTPILRPLVGFNKDEIIKIAREIGTEAFSKDVDEYCAMVPSKPATAAKLEIIEAEETKLDFSLLERAVAERSVIDLRTLDLSSLDRTDLQIDHIPAGAIVIDLRSNVAFRGWHFPEALHLDFANALEAFPHFDKDHRYVLYCEFGMKSAHLAELMQRAGLDATHFGGGLSDLLTFSESQGVAVPERYDREAPGPG
jgi:thiamine biosynthesis protein ThiI